MKFTLWPNNLFFRYSLFFSLLLSISTTTVSCAGPELSDKNSESLRVAVLPWQSSKGQQEKLQPLAKYLGTHLKHPVNFQITKNYTEAVDLIVKEEVDMAYLAALTYIKARERNPNIKPLVIPINRISGRPWYLSLIHI